MVFIGPPLFRKYLSFSDEEMRALQNVLLERPDAGAVIVSGKGLRKMRFALPGRGKRGGARVIYYRQGSPCCCSPIRRTSWKI
jgi:hypothetical protein